MPLSPDVARARLRERARALADRVRDQHQRQDQWEMDELRRQFDKLAESVEALAHIVVDLSEASEDP